jgi:DMSO/TMAO reductase YedYZ heme-binding membrane subunit
MFKLKFLAIPFFATYIFQALSHSVNVLGLDFVFGLFGWVSFVVFIIMLGANGMWYIEKCERDY